MDGPLVRIRGLAAGYDGIPVVSDVELEVAAGTTLAVIGPNGSGKSTLLRAVAGLLDPMAGSIEVRGHDVALVLQATDVDPSLPITVRETVRMARYAHRGSLGRLRAEDHGAVDVAMARMEVEALADRQIHTLSGGQRQRVFVAQGLAQEAAVLLLDEAVTGLDLVSRESILGAVEEERDRGRAVIMSTHALDEARRCDRVLLLATRQVAFGPAEEVLAEAPLREAFGTRVLTLGEGRLLLDDPHHLGSG